MGCCSEPFIKCAMQNLEFEFEFDVLPRLLPPASRLLPPASICLQFRLRITVAATAAADFRLRIRFVATGGSVVATAAAAAFTFAFTFTFKAKCGCQLKLWQTQVASGTRNRRVGRANRIRSGKTRSTSRSPVTAQTTEKRGCESERERVRERAG